MHSECFEKQTNFNTFMSNDLQSNDSAENKNYGADSIQVLEGLEAVRKDPPCILAMWALRAYTTLYMR